MCTIQIKGIEEDECYMYFTKCTWFFNLFKNKKDQLRSQRVRILSKKVNYPFMEKLISFA